MQTTRISRKLLYKAYGLAVSKRMASAKGARSVSTQQGKGAVFIARNYKVSCLDQDTHNTKKRIETPTKTKHNATIDSEKMLRLLKDFDDNSVRDATELSAIVNDMIVCCGFEQRIKTIGLNLATQGRTIVDSFLIIENGKEYSRNVTFQAAAFWERDVKFESGCVYTLLYAQDMDNKDMFLIRLTPTQAKEIVADTIFESLVIMNKLRKVEIGLSVRPNANKKIDTSLIDGITNIIGNRLNATKDLIQTSIDIPYDLLQAHVTDERLKAMNTNNAADRRDTFHPTYAFLRLQLPVLRFINTS